MSEDSYKLSQTNVSLNAGDIEIGAVEIKDATTDVRQNVTLDSAQNAAFVQSESLAQESGGNLDTIAGDTTSIDGKVSLAANQLPDGHAVTVDNVIGDAVYSRITDGVETANVTANNELNTLSSNWNLEMKRGNVMGIMCVSKFGEAPNGVQTTATDLWSRANATPTQQIWLAPTAARIHTIASDSAADDTGGTGCNSVVVSYLPDWDTAETTETVTGNLNGGIAMNNAAVMIHRIKAVAQSTTTSVGINAGTITATAATDATITAVILPNDGQTEMAIYGVPSTQTFYLTRWSASVDKAQGAAASIKFAIRLNSNPDVQTVAFARKEDLSVQSTGASSFEKKYDCYPKFPGPCIIKVQGVGSSADLDANSGFDGYVVTN